MGGVDIVIDLHQVYVGDPGYEGKGRPEAIIG
jgi:hypothetical protein